MARLKFLLAFLALLICAGGVSGAYFYWKNFALPDIVVTRHMDGKDSGILEKPDLGKRHYDAAIQLLKDGELLSGRDRLLYLIEYYPESKTYLEAKRVVGEVNLDLLISNIPLEGKKEHIVTSGEALVMIARRGETTIDYLMRVNGKTTALIYPDEALVVYPLEFRAEINLKKKKLTLFDKDKFFKEYTIVDTNLPSGLKPPVTTSVSEKVAWHIDRSVNFTNENYLHCRKWVRTGTVGLFIRQDDSKKDADRERRPYGVMVKKSDMEEIFTILRNGSKVELVN